jgi:hypothetical protein
MSTLINQCVNHQPYLQFIEHFSLLQNTSQYYISQSLQFSLKAISSQLFSVKLAITTDFYTQLLLSTRASIVQKLDIKQQNDSGELITSTTTTTSNNTTNKQSIALENPYNPVTNTFDLIPQLLAISHPSKAYPSNIKLTMDIDSKLKSSLTRLEQSSYDGLSSVIHGDFSDHYFNDDTGGDFNDNNNNNDQQSQMPEIVSIFIPDTNSIDHLDNNPFQSPQDIFIPTLTALNDHNDNYFDYTDIENDNNSNCGEAPTIDKLRHLSNTMTDKGLSTTIATTIVKPARVTAKRKQPNRG